MTLSQMALGQVNLYTQQAAPAEYSKYRRSSRYTLWKARRERFCHISQRELDD